MSPPPHLWIALSFTASLLFCMSNFLKAFLSSEVGYLAVLYNSTGTVIVCLIFNISEATQNYKKKGVFWNDQNLIKEGKLSIRNMLGFLSYCCFQVIILNMVMFTIYFSVLADVNTGIITSIWSVTPFFMSLADYLFFGVTLKYNHIIGITLIVVCILLLSLRNVIIPAELEETTSQSLINQPVSILIPLAFAICTPICFTLSATLGKHLSQERTGFNVTNLSFNAQLFVNFIVLIIAIFYWSNEFSAKLFWIGIASGFCESLAKTSI